MGFSDANEQGLPSSFEVLGVGSPFWDYILPVTDLFLQSLQTNKGGVTFLDAKTIQHMIEKSQSEVTHIAGGSCANVMKGLSHLDHSCALLGKIGKDEAGKKLTKSLLKAGITSLLIPGNGPTGQVIALVTADGQKTMCDFLGVSQEMRPEDLQLDAFKGTKWVHIEGYTLLQEGVTRRAMELARKVGAGISFDLANFEIVKRFKKEIVALTSQYVQVLFANAEEAFALTDQNPEQSSNQLRNLCEVAIVTMGREGCWAADSKEKIHAPAYSCAPVDTTGAGDLFAAGFLHGYLRKKSLTTCADSGARVAAVVVQVLGAEIPSSSWQKLKLELL